MKVFNNESKSFSLINTPAHVSDYITNSKQHNYTCYNYGKPFKLSRS